ncbi:MAG: response regulator [Nitrospiraceae bacterium]
MARIRVVDDEPMVLDLLQKALTRKGHEVLTADSGRKAIELFRQDRPDLTILDLNLPDINGIDVLREIRSVDPHAPVIILTGAGTEALENQARALGVTDFLQKGFSLHALGAALNRILKQPGQADPTASGPENPRAR